MTSKSIAIYSRKSKFTGKGESIDNQIELCKQYINTHYSNCDNTNILTFEDEGFSGGNTERPKFKKMMAEAKAKKLSAIVCYRLDRISRNIGDFAKLIEELDGLGISFVSIKEQFDTSSPMGRAMMYISSVFSQLERETIAERIRDNMHELSKTGRWLGGITPTGYTSASVENITVDGKTKKACKLAIIPEEAEVVKAIFATFLRNNSITKTETLLLQSDHKTKNNKYFTRFTIKNILTNPVYMMADEAAYNYLRENEADLFADKPDFDGKSGIMAYNRTIQKPGKTTVLRPPSEWIVSVGKHEALISGADWVKTQAQLKQNSSKAYRKTRSNVALLSGLLFCKCGDYMRPKLSKRMSAKGEQIYTYLCAMKEKSRMYNCQAKNINGNILDAEICEQYLAEHPIKEKQPKENTNHLRRELTEIKKEITNLVSTLAKAAGTPAEDYILKQIEKQHKKTEALKSRISETEGLQNHFSDETEQKRAALRTLVKRIVWDGEKIHIDLISKETTNTAKSEDTH